MHVNLGDQQFHLPTGKAQVLRGHTGLVVPDLRALQDRLASVQAPLADTRFGWADRGDHVEVCSPWGNLYRIYAPGSFGGMALGMPYVEFSVPVGGASSVGQFYADAFAAPISVEEDGGAPAARVGVGQNQRLVFRESETVPDYDGHHVAIYVANFSRPFHFLKERGLVTRDVENHEFRFRDIVDPATGAAVFAVEHEVRSSRHPGLRRPHVNRL
jgi:catechol 2,3-dioxygenase-like lactoylglutathione lyase family enzyme